MDFVYVLLYGNEWEDMVILLSNEDAINKSITHPDARVEIFSKNDNSGYTPTYNYYKMENLFKIHNSLLENKRYLK
jgi:hypothetical protein